MAKTSLGSLLLNARQSLQTGQVGVVCVEHAWQDVHLMVCKHISCQARRRLHPPPHQLQFAFRDWYMQPERAVDLARQALDIDSVSILAFFVLGSAHAALSAHAEAAAAFRRVVQLTAGSQPDTQRHHLHVAAAQNMLLESKHALPSSWIPTLNDARRLATVEQSIRAAVAQFSSPPRVLVCGGMGLEAVMAAQAGAAAVSILCLGNPLAASLSAELAAASGCGDRVVAAASTAELRQRLACDAAHHSNSTLLVLADALACSINWRQLAEQVAAGAPLLGTEVTVLPHEVHMRACLVHCPPAVALNEVRVC